MKEPAARPQGIKNFVILFIIPAKAGIHVFYNWIPVYTGMTDGNFGFPLEFILHFDAGWE